MDKTLLMGIVVLALIVLLALMLLGWTNRRRRQSALPVPRRVEGPTGEERFAAGVYYVATTAAGAPLDRIAVGGLGFRARAAVAVTAAGLVLSIPGQLPIWIPRAEIKGVDRATWTIDRVVERDGLVLVAWSLVSDNADVLDVPVESYLRFDAPTEASDFIAAVNSLLSASQSQSTPPSHQGGNA